MSHRPSENVVTAWARLMRAQARVLSHVEGALKEAGHPPLSWYDALLELSRVDDGCLRPVALEREMLLPQYGISRLVDRLQKAGYVERCACEADGRGQLIMITPAGKELLARMWPTYAAAIDEAVARHLTEREAATLADLLGKLMEGPGE